jgi:hypothetical protein
LLAKTKDKAIEYLTFQLSSLLFHFLHLLLCLGLVRIVIGDCCKEGPDYLLPGYLGPPLGGHTLQVLPAKILEMELAIELTRVVQLPTRVCGIHAVDDGSPIHEILLLGVDFAFLDLRREHSHTHDPLQALQNNKCVHASPPFKVTPNLPLQQTRIRYQFESTWAIYPKDLCNWPRGAHRFFSSVAPQPAIHPLLILLLFFLHSRKLAIIVLSSFKKKMVTRVGSNLHFNTCIEDWRTIYIILFGNARNVFVAP